MRLRLLTSRGVEVVFKPYAAREYDWPTRSIRRLLSGIRGEFPLTLSIRYYTRAEL